MPRTDPVARLLYRLNTRRRPPSRPRIASSSSLLTSGPNGTLLPLTLPHPPSHPPPCAPHAPHTPHAPHAPLAAGAFAAADRAAELPVHFSNNDRKYEQRPPAVGDGWHWLGAGAGAGGMVAAQVTGAWREHRVMSGMACRRTCRRPMPLPPLAHQVRQARPGRRAQGARPRALHRRPQRPMNTRLKLNGLAMPCACFQFLGPGNENRVETPCIIA